MGKVLRDEGPPIFQIESSINTEAFPSPFDFLRKANGRNAKDRATYLAATKSLKHMPNCAKRKMFHSIEAPYATTSVQAGLTPAVHEVTLEHVYRQHLVEVEGQTDILTMGIPFISPYNPEGLMNPILVTCMGLGYLFNMYRNKPLRARAGW